ncbi:hypothetical protein B5X24_HaOG216621 [Helicoverpa armigera]|nr:hypothetical protein B5X24_HaOG216621 [Helicoverpa armigera]
MDLHRLRVVEFDTLVSEQKGDNKYIPELEEPVEEDCKKSAVDNTDETNETDSTIKGLAEANSPTEPSKLCQGDVKNSPSTSKKYIGVTNNPIVATANCAGDTLSPLRITSNKYKREQNKQSGTPIKFLGNRLSRPRTSKKNLGSYLGLPGTSKQCAVDSTSVPGTSKNSSSSISRKSKSEIFKIPSKYKWKNREHKYNLSVVDITKQFHESAHTRQKRRPLNLFNRKSRCDQHVGAVHAKNEEVNFVFVRDTPSFIKYCKRRAEKHDKGKKRKRDTKLPSDIFGFQKKTRYFDPHLYQMSCHPFKKLRKGFHRKPKEPVCLPDCLCKHHTVKVLNSGGQGEPASSLYYNIHSPHLHKPHRRRRYDEDESFQRDRVWFKGKDVTVGVSPSSLTPLIRCRCDARIGPSKAEVANLSSATPGPRSPARPSDTPGPLGSGEAPSAPSKPKGKGSKTKKPYPQHSTPSPSTAGPSPASTKRHPVAPIKKGKKVKKKNVDACKERKKIISDHWKKFLSKFKKIKKLKTVNKKETGKKALKYIFFGLLIMAWSPCLLAVILVWAISCPIKMTTLVKADYGVSSKKSIPLIHSFLNRFRKRGTESEYQRMCFENGIPTTRSFVTSVASWYARAVGTVMNSFNAMMSMLKLKNVPTRAASSFLPSNHPNPRKKYTMCYADNRGWMMKPPRRSNSRSYASTRVVQHMRCECNPTFWVKTGPRKNDIRKSTCQNIIHECPVHGSQCIPNFGKAESSPAGDAGPVTCGDKCTRKQDYRPQHQQYVCDYPDKSVEKFSSKQESAKVITDCPRVPTTLDHQETQCLCPPTLERSCQIIQTKESLSHKKEVTVCGNHQESQCLYLPSPGTSQLMVQTEQPSSQKKVAHSACGSMLMTKPEASKSAKDYVSQCASTILTSISQEIVRNFY